MEQVWSSVSFLSNVLAKLIHHELCVRSLPHVYPLGCRCSMLQVPCMPQVRPQRPEKARLAGTVTLGHHLPAEQFPLPAVLFLGVNNASTVQPVVSISLQAAKLRPWGFICSCLKRRLCIAGISGASCFLQREGGRCVGS